MSNDSNFKVTDTASCVLRAKRENADHIKFSGHCRVVCKDKDGNVKWVDEGPNVVTNEGLNYILGTAILDSATIYIGLTEASPTAAAGDTMASHAGWAEAAGYSSGTRPAWGQDAAASQAVTNSTPVTFTMSGVDTSIGGAFLTTDSTKDGTTGTLIAVKAFTAGNKTVGASDTLDVTYTISSSG